MLEDRLRRMSFAMCLTATACGSADDADDGDEGAYGIDERERLAEQEPDTAVSVPEAAAAVAALGLPATHRCGNEMKNYRAGKKATKTLVFAGKDMPWHDWRGCLEDLTARIGPQAPAVVRDTIYNQVIYLLSHGRIELRKQGGGGGKGIDALLDKHGVLDVGKHDRLVETNQHGVAYSTMDQVDMGIVLLRIHNAMLADEIAEDHRTQAYLTLGTAALDVIVDKVGDGGLRSKKTCEKNGALTCSWFHAQTSTEGEQTKQGGTLNKHLYGVRDLYQAGNVLVEIHGKTGDVALLQRAGQYQDVAMQGMNQLVYANAATKDGDLPVLMDYIPRKNGKPITKSWLYYGRNILEGDNYFLDNGYKNCSYHLLVIKLLHRNLGHMLDEGLDVGGFGQHREELGTSVVDYVIDVYERKRDSEPDGNGLWVDTDTKPEGEFSGCDPEVTKEPLDPIMLAELRAMLE